MGVPFQQSGVPVDGTLTPVSNLGERMATVATRLIGFYGDFPVTFTRTLPGSFDPTTGLPGAPILQTYISQGVSSQFTQAELSGSNVQYGDLKYLIYPPVDGTIPVVGDTVTLSGIVYRLMNVVNNNLQGAVMYFELQLRV